ncbi:hypothetical protein SAMN05421593_1179 [Chryseobacterium culicis]|uniref:HTH luxR-type domain-containing protein n=2 Tax=Chryseobacterium culicis TaxID=680127 RepID=A0A1H6H2V6_CHRCI|nr:hypothetical protein SAMN05421593_1179 [Chryseobacterium culicis]
MILLLIFSVNCIAKKNNAKVDSLLVLADYYVDRDYSKTLFYAKKAISISEKAYDSEKIVWSYYYAAKASAWLKLTDQSLRYIDMAIKQDIRDPLLHSVLLYVKGVNYGRIGMHKLAIDEFKKVLEITENEKSAECKLVRAKAYYALADENTSNVYLHKAMRIINSIPKDQLALTRRTFRFQSSLYQVMGMYFLQKKQMDSASYYFTKAYKQSFHDDVKPKSEFLVSFGDYYQKLGDDDKALKYYLLCMDEINRSDTAAFTRDGPGLLEKIYLIYHKKGDKKNEEKIRGKYYQEQHEFARDLNHNVLKTVNLELNKKMKESYEHKKKSQLAIFCIIIFVILVIVTSSYLYIITHRKKNAIITEKQQMLILKERQTVNLSLRVEGALDEVIDAAKKNKIQFWPLFQKLHPDFVKILTGVNPDLKTTELILCAFIFLGFNTKDIAEYTFKAVQTVKNNKHNLRKRLGLPPKQDLSIWIRSLYHNNINE